MKRCYFSFSHAEVDKLGTAFANKSSEFSSSLHTAIVTGVAAAAVAAAQHHLVEPEEQLLLRGALEANDGGAPPSVMAKRFRLRISRVIPSFHSCRCKDDAAAAATAASSRPVLLSAVNPKALGVGLAVRGKLRHEPIGRRRVPVVSSSCGCAAVSSNPDAATTAGVVSPSAYLWRKEERWHVVARAEPAPRLKIDSDGGGRELFPPLPLPRRPRRAAATAKKKQKRRRKAKSKRPSNSSAETHWFSSEEEEEYVEDHDYEGTETLVSSSRSFSTDYASSSSEFTPKLKPIRESPPSPAADGRRSAAASSFLRRFLMKGPPCGAAAEGKVAESFAVVKRSEDPYEDFRRSMMEMVVEKSMYEERDLEQLLRCFLSLNSRHHHAAIVRAFSDVWAALFLPSHSCTSTAATPPPPLAANSC